ncbi:MAG TPA: thiamine-phosphate kinase [Phycisphaerales bacterium]|nr:thiamine-phosphate kinase [Phycisphaerales bacterium]
MREGELLALIYNRSTDLRAAFPQVLVGPGDDCALVGVGAAHPGVLLKTDQLIEGRHFTPGTPLDLIARKAIARAVSDIAAMAGTPRAALAACALPPGYEQRRADELFDACSRWSRHFGAPLVGGDIASFATDATPLTLTITLVGLPHPSRGPVLRSTARPSDHVYITGRIGGSFDAATGMGRHLTFEPRVTEAHWLADTLGPQLHAMMDLSDGLGIDAGRLGAASRVQLELDVPRSCLHDRARQHSADRNLVLQSVSDGEDYELLFTADTAVTLPPTCPLTGTPITRIGRCLAGEPACYLLLDGERLDVSGRGWEHT